MRNLASIQIIESLKPIENADRIVVATMKNLGWHCIVKKNEFNIGNKIIYIEIDSIVPDIPEFEFLKNKKFRVKTIKLKGQISQGLIVPISLLKNYDNPSVGEDVTTILGIKKYDTETIFETTQNKSKKYSLTRFIMSRKYLRWVSDIKFIHNLLFAKKVTNFPSWVPKTDETRIQSNPSWIVEYADSYVEITEKLDGTSATYTLKNRRKLIIASRNHTTNDKGTVYYRISKIFYLHNILKRKFKLKTAIQGEIVGPKIQGNNYRNSNINFYVFNIIDNTGKKYGPQKIQRTCNIIRLNNVPIIYKGRLKDFATTVDEIVKKSNGTSFFNEKAIREGIVVRIVKSGCVILSFKVINPLYKL